jgi:hypothetical protein
MGLLLLSREYCTGIWLELRGFERCMDNGEGLEVKTLKRRGLGFRRRGEAVINGRVTHGGFHRMVVH